LLANILSAGAALVAEADAIEHLPSSCSPPSVLSYSGLTGAVKLAITIQ
jgi:hypothetical protein